MDDHSLTTVEYNGITLDEAESVTIADTVTLADTDEFNSQELAQDAPLEKEDSSVRDFARDSSISIAVNDDATTETPFEQVDLKSRDPEKRSDNFTEAENGGVEESIEAPSTPTTLVVHSLPLTTESRISKSLSLAVHNEPIFREHVESNDDFPHLRTHFQLMAVSILMILIGMVLIVTVLVMVSHPIGEILPMIITAAALLVLGITTLGINILFCRYIEKKNVKKHNYPVIYEKKVHHSTTPSKQKHKKWKNVSGMK